MTFTLFEKLCPSHGLTVSSSSLSGTSVMSLHLCVCVEARGRTCKKYWLSKLMILEGERRWRRWGLEGCLPSDLEQRGERSGSYPGLLDSHFSAVMKAKRPTSSLSSPRGPHTQKIHQKREDLFPNPLSLKNLDQTSFGNITCISLTKLRLQSYFTREYGSKLSQGFSPTKAFPSVSQRKTICFVTKKS